jgi:3-dehydroquinate synthase
MAAKERVGLGERSYDIVIDSGLLGEKAGRLIAKLGGRALVVSNRRVYALYGQRLAEGLEKAGVKWDKTLLPDGEKSKTMKSVGALHDALAIGKYDRDSLVIALGGGVIGDVVGFASATYMRGVRFAQVPTTLLAQVDSSVGGKTGVNHPKGKNLIGAFHQPSLVIADVDTLATLSKKEVLGGVAEVIKYGCIADAKFFEWLEKNMESLVNLDPGVTAKAVSVSCRIKARVVESDERETGLRATLNFGHTVGHAVEAATGYTRYIHGHAVAIGMATAAELSVIKGTLTQKDRDAVTGLIRRAGLPVALPKDIGLGDIMDAMEMDKKAKSGSIRFILLHGMGDCRIHADVTRKEIAEALMRIRRN